MIGNPVEVFTRYVALEVEGPWTAEAMFEGHLKIQAPVPIRMDPPTVKVHPVDVHNALRNDGSLYREWAFTSVDKEGRRMLLGFLVAVDTSQTEGRWRMEVQLEQMTFPWPREDAVIVRAPGRKWG